MSPAELFKEAIDEEENGTSKRRRKIKDHLYKYIEFLNKSNDSPYTIKTRLSIVKSFYNSLEIEMPSLPRSKNSITCLEKNLAIPTKNDLAETLNACENKLERAIILTGISSGLSSVDIRDLKVKTFKEGYDPETEITTLKLRRSKTNVDFITFLTPEASRAIWEYIKYRSRTINADHKKRKAQLDKQRIYSDDNYLFVLKRIDPKYLENKDEELRRLNRNTYMEIYRSVAMRAHKRSGKGDWNLIRSHNLRKFFNSALLNAGADSFFTEYCMGHKIDGTKAAYFRGDPVKLRNIYARYIPYLTIQKDLDISETPDFKRLTEENRKLKAQITNILLEEVRRIRENSDKMTDEERAEMAKMKQHKSLKEIAENLIELRKQEAEGN